MHCVILVLPSRFIARPDARRFVLPDVPPSTTRSAWHDRLPPQSKTVTVSAEELEEVDFVLGLANLPKY